MRIGMIAPPWMPVPPLAYGGTEAVIDDLARGLSHGPRRAAVHRRRVDLPGTAAACSPRRRPSHGRRCTEAAHVLAAYEALAATSTSSTTTPCSGLCWPAAARGRMARPPVRDHHPQPLHARSRCGCSPRPPGAPSSWRSRRRTPARPAACRSRRSSTTASTCDSYQPRTPGTAGTCCSSAGCRADKGVHRAVRVARRAGPAPGDRRRRCARPTSAPTTSEQVRPLLGPDAEPAARGSAGRGRAACWAARLPC